MAKNRCHSLKYPRHSIGKNSWKGFHPIDPRCSLPFVAMIRPMIFHPKKCHHNTKRMYRMVFCYNHYKDYSDCAYNAACVALATGHKIMLPNYIDFGNHNLLFYFDTKTSLYTAKLMREHKFCTPFYLVCSHLWCCFSFCSQTGLNEAIIIGFYTLHLQITKRKDNSKFSVCSFDQYGICHNSFRVKWPSYNVVTTNDRVRDMNE